MAIKRTGKAPAKKATAVEKDTATTETSAVALTTATAKLTVSLKRRLANGDEVFLAPGIEMHCATDDLDATQEAVTDRVNAWLETLVEAYPDVDLDDEEAEEDDEDEAEEDEDEDEGDEDEGDEIEVSEEEVAKMKLADLKKLIEEAELDIDTKGKKVAALREEVLEALFGEEEEDGDEEEEDEADEEEEDDEGDEEGLTEEDLQAMKLKELQELCEEWEIGEPTVKKGANLAAKKAAYIKYILENAEG